MKINLNFLKNKIKWVVQKCIFKTLFLFKNNFNLIGLTKKIEI